MFPKDNGGRLQVNGKFNDKCSFSRKRCNSSSFCYNYDDCANTGTATMRRWLLLLVCSLCICVTIILTMTVGFSIFKASKGTTTAAADKDIIIKLMGSVNPLETNGELNKIRSNNYIRRKRETFDHDVGDFGGATTSDSKIFANISNHLKIIDQELKLVQKELSRTFTHGKKGNDDGSWRYLNQNLTVRTDNDDQSNYVAVSSSIANESLTSNVQKSFQTKNDDLVADGNSKWQRICFLSSGSVFVPHRKSGDRIVSSDNFSAYSLNEHRKTASNKFSFNTGNLNQDSPSSSSHCFYLPTYLFRKDGDKNSTSLNSSSNGTRIVSKQASAAAISFPTDIEICDEGDSLCADKSACISSAHWCDGIVHCPDASDEIGCSCKERIDRDKLCDGYFDCPNGEDERGCFGCSEDSFSCDDWTRWRPNSTCVPMSQRCDDHLDCVQNGKDEKDCLLLASNIVHQQTFLMSYSSGFLHRNWKGHWYPACVAKFSNWPTLACQTEIGPNMSQGKPSVTLTPVRTNIYKDQFIWEVPDKSPQLIEYCHKNDHAIYVSCPELQCGIRYSNILEAELSRLRIQPQNIYRLKKRHNSQLPPVQPVSTKNQQNNTSRIDTISLLKILKLLQLDFPQTKNTTTATKIRKPREEERVVGGHPSGPSQWPWLIALYQNGIFHCGGVILDTQWIMTAAHCVHHYEDNYYEVQAGILRRLSFSPMEQTRSVSHVIVHEAYSRFDMNNDLALLRLEQPFRFNRWVRPICLPEGRPPWGPIPGSMCTAVGWGATVEHGPDPDNMRDVEVPILAQCKHSSDRKGEEICAGYVLGGHDTCQGDSGGPLLCRIPTDVNRWYVAGIVSHGEGCARPMEPGAYTRVSLFLPWIIQNTDENAVLSTKRPMLQCPGIKCHSGGRCISNRRVCDRVIDCLTGQDEISCQNPSSKYDLEMFQIVRDALSSNDSSSILAKTALSSESNDTAVVLQRYDHTEKSIVSPTIKQISTSTMSTNSPDSSNSTTGAIAPLLSTMLQSHTNYDQQSATNNITWFTCYKLRQVIPNEWYCDGIVDCEDASDEANCTCRNYLYRLNKDSVCDGLQDCYDMTDELSSHCHPIAGLNNRSCVTDEFYCPKSRTCIKETRHCDGHNDCIYGEDEQYCYALLDGFKLRVNMFGYPVTRWQGIIAYNRHNVWRPLCTDNSIISNTAHQTCVLLGYSFVDSYEKIMVYNESLPIDGRKRIADIDIDKLVYCVGVNVTCSQTHYSDAIKHTWHVDIYIDGRRHCPAVLLTSEWIIADRQCCMDEHQQLLNVTERYVTALLGGNRYSEELVQSPNEQIIRLSEIRYLPEYGLMIAHLQLPVISSEYVKPLGLPQWIPAPMETDKCVGIGYNSVNNTIVSFSLHPITDSSTDCTGNGHSYNCYFVPDNRALCTDDNKFMVNFSSVICSTKESGWYLSAIFDSDHAVTYCSHRDAPSLRLRSFAQMLSTVSDIIESIRPVGWQPQKLSNGCENGYRCSMGKCLNWTYVCDGVPHCRNHEDELPQLCAAKAIIFKSKPTQLGLKCRQDEIICQNGRCADKSLLCDGVDNCGDNTDEMHCANFTCAVYLKLTEPSKLCDLTVDCIDKTDENIQQCHLDQLLCHDGNNGSDSLANTFRCKSTNICIPREFICDGERDCLHGEDEAECLSLDGISGRRNEGFLMLRSYGEWHAECLPADFTTSDMQTICEYLGFQRLLDVQYFSTTVRPTANVFTTIRINSDINISLRIRRPQPSVDQPELCHKVLLFCASE